MWRANSSGLPLSGSMPCGRQLITTSFEATASRTARASLSMISRGVPAGAMRPNQIEVSKSGMPASAMVGTFGKMPGRFDAADARARSEPASTWEITAEAGENIIVTRPARRSVAAGHVHELDACAHAQELAREMWRRADAGGSVKNFARLRFGERDQLLHILDAGRRRHHQDHGCGVDQRDRGKVLGHIEREFGIDRRVGDIGGRRDEERVAVVRGAGDKFGCKT